MNFINRKQKLESEDIWYKKSTFRKRHIFNRPLFYSPERNEYAYHMAKSYLPILLRSLGVRDNSKLLLAPVGTGNDYKYIKQIVRFVYGIDISPTAVDTLPPYIAGTVGDILKMQYPDESFDYIICSLFFHHVIDETFEIYLFELKRILKTGGYIIILEPSIYYPMHWISRPILKLFGNITGAVPGERPLDPLALKKSLTLVDFSIVRIYAATFTYHRFPIFLTKLIKYLDDFFRSTPVVKYFGWLVYFVAKKKNYV